MSTPSKPDDHSTEALRRWAPNPFALAAVALGRPIDERDAGAVLADLREAFRIDPEVLWQLGNDTLLGLLTDARIGAAGMRSTAHALIDVARQWVPDHALYGRLLEQPTLQLGEAVKSILAEGGSPLAKALAVFSDDKGLTKLEGLLPYVLSVAVADGPGGEPRTLLDVRQTEGLGAGRQDQPIVAGEVDYLDPQQGLTCDCWLIAGLIAFAWTYPQQWRHHVRACSVPAASAPLKFNWTLFSGEASEPTPDHVTITPTWLIDRKSKVRIGAQSTDTGEYWPALVEKAYVRNKAREEGAALAAGAEPKLTDYKRIEFQSLHGELPKVFRIVSADSRMPEHWIQIDNPPAPAAADRLARPVNATVAVTKKRLPPGTPPGLIKNHAYALLGMVRLDGVDSVVLRDPYGWPSDARRSPADRGRRVQVGDGTEVELGNAGVFACPWDVFDKAFHEVVTFEHG